MSSRTYGARAKRIPGVPELVKSSLPEMSIRVVRSSRSASGCGARRSPPVAPGVRSCDLDDHHQQDHPGRGGRRRDRPDTTDGRRLPQCARAPVHPRLGTLIFERRDGRFVALDVKLSPIVTDDDVKHLVWRCDRLARDMLDAAVITTGTDAYRRPHDDIAVIPAALLGA